MTLRYGFIKTKLATTPALKAKTLPHETQYHLHFSCDVDGQSWDVAVNVGTDDADDLLKYKIIDDFRHSLVKTLAESAEGARDLTGTAALPALDFLRSDILNDTGPWLTSDIMDGGTSVQPVAALKTLLTQAHDQGAYVYVFGRFYTEGNGIHDVHFNQGSRGRFVHKAGNDANDHNDIWQDGGLIVDLTGGKYAAYFAAFNQQLVPTDDLGNPQPRGHSL